MEKISWPSERIAHGGIFHQRNVNYSKETHDMIKSKWTSLSRGYFILNVLFFPPSSRSSFIPPTYKCYPRPSALMSEANLTMMQRNKINYFLRQGSALPQLEMQRRKLPSEEYELRRAREIMDRSRVVRKRSWETIAKSGVFEIER